MSSQRPAAGPAIIVPALTLLAAALASPAALGQQPEPGAAAAAEFKDQLGLDAIMARLDPTEESVDLVEPAVVEVLEKHTDLLESARAGTADEARLQQEMDRSREETHERLRGVLNAAQLEELNKIQDELGAQVLAQAVSL